MIGKRSDPGETVRGNEWEFTMQIKLQNVMGATSGKFSVQWPSYCTIAPTRLSGRSLP